MYRAWNKLLLLAILATAQPHLAIAEIHSVVIKDNFFIPNDLMINPGDTVRWTSNTSGSCGSYGDCSMGTLHSVAADDFSFSSGAPAERIFFTQEFNEAGVILYHCQVHSLPGQNRNSSMNGRITVKSAQIAFQLNAGLNDAWFNPDTDGQGFFITIFPVLAVATLAWFTYDTDLPTQEETAKLGDPGHRWLTALGTIEGNQSEMHIVFTSGGLFDTPTDVTRADGGTITLTFEDCNSGTIDYNIPSIDRMDSVPIQRVASDNIALCEALTEP